MKNIFFVTLSILITSTSICQDIDIFKPKDKKGYKIEGYVNELQDTSIILAYYFGGKQYASDTAYSKNGSFTFFISISMKSVPDNFMSSRYTIQFHSN